MKKKKKNANTVPTSILWTAKLLESVNPAWASQFAIKIFSTPIRHQRPKREANLYHSAEKLPLEFPQKNTNLHVYHWKNGPKKALVVHGWSGRGTQLCKIIEALLEAGYSVYSFDAPAHGDSKGKRATLLDFIASNHLMDAQFGPFDATIGHSLGSMSLFNAISEGLQTKSLVGIGSGNSVENILTQFVELLQLKPQMTATLLADMNAKFQSDRSILEYSAHAVAPKIDIPVLMIHDQEDKDVPIEAMRMMQGKIRNLEMLETNGLGHRKILGDPAVIKRTIEFIQKHQ